LKEAAQSGVLGAHRPIGVRQEPSAAPPLPVAPTEKSGKKEKRERERMTVYLPIDLAEWVRVQAARGRKEISEIVEMALEDYRAREGR